MSNYSQEHLFNRRQLLKLAVVLSAASSPLTESFAASPVNLRLMLGRPTKSSIAISLISNKDVKAFVQYGASKGRYSGKTVAKKVVSGNPVVFDLTNLKANSKVYYRLAYTEAKSKKVMYGDQYSFWTQRSKGSEFSFTLHGDTHPERKGKMFNEDLYEVALRNVQTQNPDFHILMGDDFSIDPLINKGQVTAQNVDKVYETHRRWLEIIGSSTPIYLVNGNHEQAAGYLLDGTKTNPAVLAGKSRVKYFPLPAPDSFYSADSKQVEGIGYLRDYYAWEWGDALFVTLDPYWHSQNPVDNVAGVLPTEDQESAVGAEGKKGTGKTKKRDATDTPPKEKDGGNGKTKDLWSIGIGDEQYAWLKKTLETSTAKYKFVFAHHVMGTGRGAIELSYDYEWGGNDPKGVTSFAKERPNWELPIHDLMVKNKVSIFFQGHDHIFVTQERDGLIYQSMPNPADDTFRYFNESAYKSGTKAPNSGHVRVTVGANEAIVEYFLAARTQDSTRKNLEIGHRYTVLPNFN